MTREEAIKFFNTVLFFGKCDCPKEEIEEYLKMAIKALEQEPTTKNDLALIHTEGLDEEIRCTMCTNSMQSDRGCDGSCVVNNAMYKAVMDAIEKRIQPTTKNDLGVDWDELKRKILMEVDGGTDDKWLRYADVCDRISNSIDEYVQNIKASPSVTPQEQRWIPVSEYLPVTNDEVLVTYIVNGNAKKRYVETANCYDGEWSSVNDEYRIPNTKIEIIAWCEMPKPYSEVKE